MTSITKRVFGSSLNRNVIVVATIMSVGFWFALGSTSIPTMGWIQVTILSVFFGLIGVIFSTLVKMNNIQGISKYYSLFTSIICVFMTFIWLGSTTRASVSLSFFVLGFVFVSYIEIMKSLYDI